MPRPSSSLTVTDTNTNLIWLKDWNVSFVGGWATQNAWAETGLDGFTGSNDWHLPSIDQYLALSRVYGSITTPFVDVALGNHWSSTQHQPGQALSFDPQRGRSAGNGMDQRLWAVAVRTGDVVGRIPEPQALMLVMTALGAAAVVRRRRPH